MSKVHELGIMIRTGFTRFMILCEVRYYLIEISIP